ncbi:MAG: hypothetical protein RR404_02375 [Bacilli bacterium]
MNEIISMIIAFVIVYLLYLFLVILSKKGRKKLKSGIEATFLSKTYKLDLSKVDDKKFAWNIALNNSLIVSITFYITGLFFNKPILQILLSFPIIILLIILLYSLLGRYYKRKI